MANKAVEAFPGSRSAFGGAVNMAGGIKMSLADKFGGKSLSLNNQGKIKLIAQQLNISASRQNTTLYDLFTNDVFYVAGRAQVQLNLARVVGPAPIQLSWYRRLGEVCNVGSNNILVDYGASNRCLSTDGGKTLTGGIQNQAQVDTSSVASFQAQNGVFIANCLMTQIGLSISVQDFLINEATTIQATDIIVSLPRSAYSGG